MRGHRRPTRGPWKRAVASLGLVGLLLGTAACGGGRRRRERGRPEAGADDRRSPSRATRSTAARSRVGLEAETNSWLPGEGTFANPGTTVAYALYDPLMKRTADGEFEPYLAESMEPNADLTTWTLKLRPDVKFHDGTPLNAAGAQDDLRRLPHGPDVQPGASLDEVTSLDVVDDLTVEYRPRGDERRLPRRAHRLPRLAVLPDRGGGARSPTPAPTRSAPAPSSSSAGSATASWSSRRTRTTGRRACPTWTRSRSGRSRTRTPACPACRAVTSTSCRPCGRARVARARELDGVDNYEYLGNNSGGSIINTTIPPFDDVRVRQGPGLRARPARRSSRSLGGTGLTPAATQYFSPDSPFYSEKAAEAFPTYDPEQAQELYDDYINDPERSDGLPVGTDSPSRTPARPTRASTSSPSCTSPSAAALGHGGRARHGRAGHPHPERARQGLRRAVLAGRLRDRPVHHASATRSPRAR